VRYVTHQFAHPETLDRVRRWLIQAGFDPSRIEAHSQGVPRLAVAVGAGEAAEVSLLIDAAESGDPDGYPSFLELAQKYTANRAQPPAEPPPPETIPSSFVVTWRPLDYGREVIQTSTEAEADLREAYEGFGD
jgi:hypothetical protein